MSLKGKHVLIGLTGGIACYKIPYLVRSLTKSGAEVQIVMTEAATHFITPLTMETMSNRAVALDLFPKEKFVSTHHIDLATWPDILMIAPATANFIGKVASGISDDLLTTIVCATPKPVKIAPAMNPQMWSNPITQRNYKILKDLGYDFVMPTEGNMACDHFGVGRMQEPEILFDHINKYFKSKPASKSKKKSLSGKNILITAGPTREHLDPVRYISNHSSGKMGYSLAEVAKDLGASVTLISGPTSLTVPSDVKLINIQSTHDLHKAVKKEFPKNDCLIMSAAPADYTPKEVKAGKIKKSDMSMDLKLKPTVDILKDINKIKKKNQIVVGFALETENGIANARKKLKEKNLDLIVLNQPGDGTAFDSDTNQVTIIRPRKKNIELPKQSKLGISFCLLDIISSLV
jgi:phosphopantothenoylcysteine decarboxylase/phosphopantothenate--cysteine ligase